MYTDNLLSTSKYRLAYIATFLLSIGSFIYYYVDRPHPISLLVSGIIFGVVFLFMLLVLRPSFFSFCDDKDPIEIRTYNAFPILRKHVAFSIKKQLLHKYIIKKQLFGLRRTLSITIRGLNKQHELENYTYPDFNISSLSPSEVEVLEKQLNQYINANLERKSHK
ncbi:MAG: hypothetical protein J5826_06120 [Bacteroidales bacterium]|nr:hypothetical protein [Bacteroidales bacterium]MBP5369549.1 hypothetical protein [Bacteroidales bacterium]